MPDWATFLAGGMNEEDVEQIRMHSRTGRPLGSQRFVQRLERRLGRTLAPQRPGPKPKDED